MSRRAGAWAACLAVLALSAVVASGAVAKPSGAGPGPPSGNKESAKACQKGGFENYARSDGTAFASEEECMSYAAKGGALQSPRTAQSVCESAGGTFFEPDTSGPIPSPMHWSCAFNSAPSTDTITTLEEECFDAGGNPISDNFLAYGSGSVRCMKTRTA